MRYTLFLTITIASLLALSERVVSGPIGIRMDETIRLGSTYGLMVDMDTAFAQEETLGPIFRSQFQQFKDLTAENIANRLEHSQVWGGYAILVTAIYRPQNLALRVVFSGQTSLHRRFEISVVQQILLPCALVAGRYFSL